VGDGSVAARYELRAAFADVWCAIPKVVFSRTLDSVQGNGRLAEASVVDEAAAALDATDKDVSIGGAGLAAAAIEDAPAMSRTDTAVRVIRASPNRVLPLNAERRLPRSHGARRYGAASARGRLTRPCCGSTWRRTRTRGCSIRASPRR
jgi:hypothetical protein